MYPLCDSKDIARPLISSYVHNNYLHSVCRAAMHTFRREDRVSQTLLSSSETETHTDSSKDTKTMAAHPDSQATATTPENDQQQVHNLSDDHSLDRTNIIAYTAIEKREGLSTIARRLLHDVHLRTSVSFQKSFHPSDRVPRASDTGLGTIGLSAFMLSSLGNPTLRRAMVREMWDSSADVLVSLFPPRTFVICVRLVVYGGLFILATATSCLTVLARTF